jgi:hypothetical protein
VRCLVIPWNAMFSNAITLHVFTIARHSPEYYEEWVADLVGEPFERIPGPVGAQFCCRHNGVSLGLRENMVATALAHDAGTVSLSEYIAGQVVVVGPPDGHGYDTSVPNVLLTRLRDLNCAVEG